MTLDFTFYFEDKNADVHISKEVIESRGYKRAVKSFQIKYPHIEEAKISWIKIRKGRGRCVKIQRLPMGRKKKIGR